MSAAPAVLVLESGRVFRGVAMGAHGEVFGEAVFNTSMTGYQEILTDPSYAGQIVVMTSVHIGNTGVNPVDVESARPMCAGFAVREGSPRASNWRSRGPLGDYLRTHGIVGVEGIDTRALTRALRTGGAQRSAIASGAFSDRAIDELLVRVRSSPVMEGRDLASEVTCSEPYVADPRTPREDGAQGRDARAFGEPNVAPTGEPRLAVVAYDFGIKRSIVDNLARCGCRVTVVPAHTTAADALALGADGFFLSNGPGDPAAVPYAAEAVRRLVDSGKPVFGICLGHQILAVALGARTYKLPFGHHGGNHPVQDLHDATIAITAQNHGFSVDRESLPDDVAVTHVDLYDGTVEGIRWVDRPVFGVQYHPEASPGPHDARNLFARFVKSMRHAP